MTTMDELIDILGAEEPDYDNEALTDPEIVPLLAALIGGTDRGLAAKAVAVASEIADEEAVALLRNAAASGDSIIRVATAAAVRNLEPDTASEILTPLVQDTDPGVRYVALGAVPESPTPELVASIETISQSETDSDVRERAEQILEGIA